MKRTASSEKDISISLPARPTTQGFCQLPNDAPEAAVNNSFFRG